jgi:hypothetical protein
MNDGFLATDFHYFSVNKNTGSMLYVIKAFDFILLNSFLTA